MTSTVTFGSVVDDIITWLNEASGYRVVGSKPDDGREFVLVWLAGGRRTTKITAEIDVEYEIWVPRTSAAADVDAEQIAEQVRATTDLLAQNPVGDLTRYRVSWPRFPTQQPPDDSIDQSGWARVTMRAAVNVRGRGFSGAPIDPHASRDQ